MPDQENKEKNGRKNLWRIAFLAIGISGFLYLKKRKKTSEGEE